MNSRSPEGAPDHPESDDAPVAIVPLASLAREGPWSEPALAASDDVQAIEAWLQARASKSKNTLSTYGREAHRLLLWLREHGLTLRTLKVEHVHAFFSHLANPPDHWIRPRRSHGREGLLDTQVMAGPLSAPSINQTRGILSQLFSYLQDAGYLRANVFRLSGALPAVKPVPGKRHLDVTSWQWLWTWITSRQARTVEEQALFARARWVFALLYHTGLRRSEVAGAAMGDLVRFDKDFKLRVVGKGSKEAFVTVNSALLSELMRYRESLGLFALPSPGDPMPLVPNVRGQEVRPMTDKAIANIVRSTVEAAAAHCPDPDTRDRLLRMTTHWMRHTSGTHRLKAGARLESVQDEFRHANINTTRIYAMLDDADRKEDAEKLAAFAARRPSGST